MVGSRLIKPELWNFTQASVCQSFGESLSSDLVFITVPSEATSLELLEYLHIFRLGGFLI